MTDQQRESWSLIYQQGLLRFVVYKGIARIGTLFAVLNIVLSYFLFPEILLGILGEILRFVFNAFFFGVVVSILIWHTNQKRYMRSDQ